MEKYTLKQAVKYIKSDYCRYFGSGKTHIVRKLFMLRGRQYGYVFSFWLRLARCKGPLGLFAYLMHRHYTVKYNIQITTKTRIGYGFYIGHGMCVVIHPRTIIGNNVNISPFLNIGSNNGTPAVIGDDVYIGPHVSIVENVTIGSNSTIGAGSVVVKDIPSGCTVVGVPAKVIAEHSHPEYIHNRFNCDKQ